MPIAMRDAQQIAVTLTIKFAMLAIFPCNSFKAINASNPLIATKANIF